MSIESTIPVNVNTVTIDKDEYPFVKDLVEYLKWMFTEYGPTLNICFLSLWQVVCGSFTIYNVIIFFIKYIPTGVYTYKFLKSIYKSSRDRLKQKQLQIEELQLQLQIMNTKMSVREAERSERAQQLRWSSERLRRVRARVRRAIVGDDALHRALQAAARARPAGRPADDGPERDLELIKELLEEMKCEPPAPEKRTENMERGERVPIKNRDSDDACPSLSDTDLSKEYRLKIIKVTNVYKVAYLKHYIKQKRLRRANRQAILKKKMESIKKLLEDWQKALSVVINSKVTLLNLDPHPIDLATQEAMGDYAKHNLREASDSESDIRNGNSDPYFDDYSMRWAQNPYRNYSYCYDDMIEPDDASNFIESKDICDNKCLNYSENTSPNMLFILPEETSSQIAIEDMKSSEGQECHDLVVL